ncbi:TetR/AcrR family transcriptional regulator [Oceanobacillus manasiensis]|uniref:TetR/AcrR family transcriptional regulator n=1 Tax=Oceanobacillus manasiensis TaxID=586413 RepID=UPI0005A94FB3|nr:TetR/AcrR family transcriptional regulator [Oceanobacillus manasiensis]
MDGFERRRERKKQSILDAALRLFMEFGVQKVSMNEIATKAKVSQVTIYNYFKNKERLVEEVIHYYVDQVWQESDAVLKSDLPFPKKIEKLIFNKKESADSIHENFYQHFMKAYTAGDGYMEKLVTNEAIPKMMRFFDEGKSEGYVDPTISNEAILFYIQMMNEHLQKKDVYSKILPMTEDIMHILYYGIVGKRVDK